MRRQLEPTAATAKRLEALRSRGARPAGEFDALRVVSHPSEGAAMTLVDSAGAGSALASSAEGSVSLHRAAQIRAPSPGAPS